MAQVYLVDSAGRSEPMERIRCKSEDQELQRLLEGNVDLLPGDQIDPDDPRRWLLVKREMPVPDPSTGSDRWSIDFFFVDHDAMPTFVECKRCADTRTRREVVGQMLEYAANGHHYWTRDLLKELATTTTGSAEALASALERLRPTDDLAAPEFFQRVEENLRQGRLRIVFFLEDSPFELRSVVDFLNKQMVDSEVLLVEARQYLAGGNRVVVPTLFGYTEEARLVKRPATGGTGSRRRWDADAFFRDAAARLADADVATVRRLYDFAVSNGCELSWGTGKDRGSFNVKDSSVCQRSLLSVFSDGTLSLNFGWLDENARVQALRDRFITLAGERLGIKPGGEAGKHFYSLDIEEWRPKSDEVGRVLARLLKEFRPA